MHCHEFETRLNHILDDRGQPRADAQLAAHAETCDDCRQLLLGQEMLLAGLRRFSPPPVSSGFSRRVVAQAASAERLSARAMPASSSRKIVWALATVLSTAAVMLLIVSLIWQARRGPMPRPGDQVAKQSTPSPGTASQPRRSRPSGLAMTQPGVSQPNWIRGYRGTIDNLAVTLPETVQRLDEVEHYAPGIRPIRISLGVLLDALWRAIPGSHGDEARPTRTSCLPVDLLRIA
ncbi:MAG TPA: hypothetical protein VFV87_13800 [Pirellulaceae bacterium]|nr:hypothetical protein [Pirellulaceae bacterium]